MDDIILLFGCSVLLGLAMAAIFLGAADMDAKEPRPVKGSEQVSGPLPQIPYESPERRFRRIEAELRANLAAGLLLAHLPRQQRRAQERKLKKAQEALARIGRT